MKFWLDLNNSEDWYQLSSQNLWSVNIVWKLENSKNLLIFRQDVPVFYSVYIE